MTDTKALLAEACERAQDIRNEFPHAAACFTRLADALERATPPEGWEVERWTRSSDGVAITTIGPAWRVAAWRSALQPAHFPLIFDSAREAMAALDAECPATHSGSGA